MIEIKLSFAPTREEALENTRFWAPLSLSAEEKHRVNDPVKMAAAADRLPITQVASRWIVETRPEGVVDAVRPYVEAGFDHLVFHAPGHDQEAFLSSFGSTVLPLLRDLGRTPAVTPNAGRLSSEAGGNATGEPGGAVRALPP